MTTADDILKVLQQKDAKQVLSRGEIVEIVKEAMHTVTGDLTSAELKLYGELAALADYIKNAKAELAALSATNISAEHIPSATDELDAVVTATADATNVIMNCCDEIGTISGRVPAPESDNLMMIVTKIYEACNFQDITGQRISKVVRTLKYIEEHVNDMVRVFGGQTQSAAVVRAPISKAADVNDEASLLNGPQLQQNAMDQDEIDKLMASFDAPAKH